MFCARCGAENADNRTLCVRCRQPLAISRVYCCSSTRSAASSATG